MNIPPPPPIIDLPALLTGMMSLILYKCFRTNDKDIFQLTNVFSRLISLTFLYCCSTTSVDSFESNFKKSAFCSNMILAETWPSCLYLITWFVGLLLKITLKGLLADWKCLWSMFGKWFLNTCVNHAIFARSRRLIWRMLRQIFQLLVNAW